MFCLFSMMFYSNGLWEKKARDTIWMDYEAADTYTGFVNGGLFCPKGATL